MSGNLRRRADRNPFSYLGVFPATPFEYYEVYGSPTSDDYSQFNAGDFWFDTSTQELWVLLKKSSQSASWSKIGYVPFSATSFPTDSGTAVTDNGSITMTGTSPLETIGIGNFAFVGLSDTEEGRLLIGGGTSPEWQFLTSAGGTFSIWTGPRQINLEATGGTGVTYFTTDSGTANPASGVITVTGDSNISTVATPGVITFNLENSITIPGDLTLVGSGAGVVQTDATGLLFSDNGTNGQVLIGGGTAPAWANITSTGGTIGITNGPNDIDLTFVGGGSVGNSSFLAYQNGDASNVTGDSTSYTTGVPATVYTLGVTTAFVSVFDPGANLSLGGGSPLTFTAPTTGKYLLTLQVTYDRPSYPVPAVHYMDISIVTTARTYSIDQRPFINSSPTLWPPSGTFDMVMSNDLTVVADMTAGDTATYTVRIDAPQNAAPPLKSVSILGGNSTEMKTFISGFLIA